MLWGLLQFLTAPSCTSPGFLGSLLPYLFLLTPRRGQHFFIKSHCTVIYIHYSLLVHGLLGCAVIYWGKDAARGHHFWFNSWKWLRCCSFLLSLSHLQRFTLFQRQISKPRLTLSFWIIKVHLNTRPDVCHFDRCYLSFLLSQAFSFQLSLSLSLSLL